MIQAQKAFALLLLSAAEEALQFTLDVMLKRGDFTMGEIPTDEQLAAAATILSMADPIVRNEFSLLFDAD